MKLWHGCTFNSRLVNISASFTFVGRPCLSNTGDGEKKAQSLQREAEEEKEEEGMLSMLGSASDLEWSSDDLEGVISIDHRSGCVCV